MSRVLRRAYRHEIYPAPDEITSDMAIPITGDGLKIPIFPRQKVPGGLVPVEDFVTEWYGAFHIDISVVAILNLSLVTKHYLPNGKSFSSPQNFRFREQKNEEATVGASLFSSRTVLRLGNRRTRDGTEITVTQALLNQEIEIECFLLVTLLNPVTRARIAGAVQHFLAENLHVVFRQQAVFLPAQAPSFATPDAVTICNRALSFVNASPISRLDSRESREARLCVRHYDGERRELLAERDWNFAKRQVALVASDYNPIPGGWSLAYEYPDNCLKFIRLVDTFGVANADITSFPDFSGGRSVIVAVPSPVGAFETPDGFGYAEYSTRYWSVLNRYQVVLDDDGNRIILTNRGGAHGEYIIDATEGFDPIFTNMLAWKLALTLAGPLGAPIQTVNALERGYARASDKAKVHNANEGSTGIRHRASWLENR